MTRELKLIFFQQLKSVTHCPILTFRKLIQQAKIFACLRTSKLPAINPFDIRLLSRWINLINIKCKKTKKDNFILGNWLVNFLQAFKDLISAVYDSLYSFEIHRKKICFEPPLLGWKC
jgi:hypothetical protein